MVVFDDVNDFYILVFFEVCGVLLYLFECDEYFIGLWLVFVVSLVV